MWELLCIDGVASHKADEVILGVSAERVLQKPASESRGIQPLEGGKMGWRR